jgi:transcriptional regulator with XRE-family HTH domain
MRKSKGLTLADVASALGTAKAVVSQWELCTKDPGRDMVFILADLLGPEVLDHFAVEARKRQSGRVA